MNFGQNSLCIITITDSRSHSSQKLLTQTFATVQRKQTIGTHVDTVTELRLAKQTTLNESFKHFTPSHTPLCLVFVIIKRYNAIIIDYFACSSLKRSVFYNFFLKATSL